MGVSLMKPAKHVVFAAVTLVWASGLSAAVYKSVDAQGNVVYTDEPSGDAKPLKLPPLSTIPGTQLQVLGGVSSGVGTVCGGQLSANQHRFTHSGCDFT